MTVVDRIASVVFGLGALVATILAGLCSIGVDIGAPPTWVLWLAVGGAVQYIADGAARRKTDS